MRAIIRHNRRKPHLNIRHEQSCADLPSLLVDYRADTKLTNYDRRRYLTDTGFISAR